MINKKDKMKKTIGIIGGMGPLATSDLFKKIIDITDADKDQDYPRVLIDNNINIPDRTMAILHGGESPVPEMVRSATILSEMGADVLIIPCNTAHYFYNIIADSVNIPVLNMIKETAAEALAKGCKKAGLLATDGTIQTGIYSNVFESSGIEMIVPEGDRQEAVMDIIYNGVKAGKKEYDVTDYKNTIQDLFDRGAETVILGCTELPLAMDLYNVKAASIDPTMALAKAAVRFSGYNVKS